MNTDEFIDAIRTHVRDQAVKDTITLVSHPPGPSWGYPRTVADRTAWVHSLDMEGQKQLQSVIRQAVHCAIFGFLCVIDGARPVEDGPDRGSFQLSYKSADGEALLTDPDDDPLHGIYNADLKL